MALALYRRYRPDTFDKVIGQDQVTIPLMRALDEGRLTHAYLFSGPRGCGKTSSARIMARCINCEQGPTSHPCGTCDSCRDLSATGGGSIDVMEIDAASHNGVEDARQLRDSVLNPPVRDRYKIIILDEAHMVTPQGFNALLKTVEEPPERVMFIFATTEPEKVIGTIRSRTHHYPFRLVPPEIMGPYLEQVCAKEHMEPETGVLKLAMRAGGGSVRDTLSVLDQLMTGAVDGRITYDSATALLGFTPDTMIGEAIDAVIDRDGAKLYDVVEKVAVGGYEPRRFVEDLLARVRDLLVLSLAGQKAESVLSDTAEAEDMDDLKRQAKALGLAKLNQMAEKINTALSTMAGAISPRMRLELLAASLLTENTPTMSAAQPAAASAGGAPTGAPSAQASPRMGFIGSKRRAAAQQTAPAQSAHSPASAPAAGRPQSSASTASAASPMQTNAMPRQQSQTPAPAQQTPAVPATDWATNPEPAATASVSATPRQGGTTSHGNAPGTATPEQPAAVHTAATPDTRSTQERWQAVLALLSEQARQYVDATKVPHVAVNEAPDRSAGKVTLTFDTALSQHAFALAVDGSNGKLPKVVLETVRKVFGARYKIAPSGIAANGEQVEPVTKMSPERQQEIRRQIAIAAAKQLATQIPGAAGFGKQTPATHDGAVSSAHREPQSSAASNASRDSQDDNGDDEGGVRHGGGPAHPALTVALPEDIDPWEHPEVIPRHGGGSVANGTPGDSGMGSVAASGAEQTPVPGRTMGTDGRGIPGQGNAMPAVAQPSQSGDAWPASGTSDPSVVWDAVPPDAGADAWAPAEPSNPNGAGFAAPAVPAPTSATSPTAMPAAIDPDSAWGAPGTASPQSVPSDADLRPPMATAAPTPAPSVGPAVDIDDESAYSMDDDSINDGQVDLDTIKKMFDVKQMEVIAPDNE